MDHFEDILPEDQQFNMVLQEFREEIVDPLYDQRDETGDVISPHSEFSRDSQSLWEVSNMLAVIMHAEGEDLEDVRTAIYRGISFALQIVDDVKSSPIANISLGDALNMEEDDEDLADSLRQQTSRYVANRRHIDDLLFSFMPELDRTERYNHHVETGALLMFLLCERQQGEDYIAESVANLRPEDLS